jgi:hypothetical protein
MGCCDAGEDGGDQEEIKWGISEKGKAAWKVSPRWGVEMDGRRKSQVSTWRWEEESRKRIGEEGSSLRGESGGHRAKRKGSVVKSGRWRWRCPKWVYQYCVPWMRCTARAIGEGEVGVIGADVDKGLRWSGWVRRNVGRLWGEGRLSQEESERMRERQRTSSTGKGRKRAGAAAASK